MVQIRSRMELYRLSKMSKCEKDLNLAECRNVSITLKLSLSELSIENKISLNITSPDSFFTCVSTLVSMAKSLNVSGGISLSNSLTVISKVHTNQFRFRTPVAMTLKPANYNLIIDYRLGSALGNLLLSNFF